MRSDQPELITFPAERDFTADKSWVEGQQNRWLAWLEVRKVMSGEARPLTFSEIEEVAGMSPWDGRAIMDSISKRLRNTL